MSVNKGKRKICAVIVSYNAPEDLMSCIDSALIQVDKIIVIDNSTSLDSKENIQKIKNLDKVSLIINKENNGLAAALNQGINYSLMNKYEWTLLLDQDSKMSDNMVSEMIFSYEKLENKLKKEVAFIVPNIYDRELEKSLPAIITSKLINKKIKNPINDCFVHFQITSGSFIRNEVVNSIGLMNENLFIDYIDFDYCFRTLNKNLKILLCKKAILYHSLGQKKNLLFFKIREHDYQRIYYQTRNRLFLLFKYGRKYKSFLYSESIKFIGKFLKFIFFETNSVKKIKMYFKGIVDFAKDYEKLNQEF